LDPGDVDYAEVRVGGPAAGRLIKQVKEQLRAVPGDGLGYGLLRYLNPATAPVLAALPVPQIGFNYLGRFTAAGPHAHALTAWQPVADTPVGGAPDPAMAATHVLQAGAVVEDLPDGPRLTLTLMCPVALLTTAVLEDLAVGWAAMLNGLTVHTTDPDSGGHTPSDFPLIELNQGDLDQLAAVAEDVGQRGP
jgi:mycobactin peptide synthetase MbtF